MFVQTPMTARVTLFSALLAAALASGCSSGNTPVVRHAQPTTAPAEVAGLSTPKPVQSIQALCPVPTGWKAEPIKQSDKHTHQVWLSPSGHTAYGVIHFSLPLPVGAEMVLPFYLKAMKKTEGEAILQRKERDPNLPGIRFVAEGGQYKTWTNLIVNGFEGWAVYAGAIRNQEIDPAELDLAKRAREHTRVGLPPDSVADTE
jgi:hypothetical protein